MISFSSYSAIMPKTVAVFSAASKPAPPTAQVTFAAADRELNTPTNLKTVAQQNEFIGKNIKNWTTFCTEKMKTIDIKEDGRTRYLFGPQSFAWHLPAKNSTSSSLTYQDDKSKPAQHYWMNIGPYYGDKLGQKVDWSNPKVCGYDLYFYQEVPLSHRRDIEFEIDLKDLSATNKQALTTLFRKVSPSFTLPQ